MDMGTIFGNINWLSVFVAAVAAFVIGGLWYSKMIFGNIWMKELNITEDHAKTANMTLIFGLTFVLNVIGAMFLDMFIGQHRTLFMGIHMGLLVSIAWVATSFGINYLFSRKSFRLFLIDAGYFVVFFTVEGAILGAW